MKRLIIQLLLRLHLNCASLQSLQEPSRAKEILHSSGLEYDLITIIYLFGEWEFSVYQMCFTIKSYISSFQLIIFTVRLAMGLLKDIKILLCATQIICLSTYDR